MVQVCLIKKRNDPVESFPLNGLGWNEYELKAVKK